MANYWIKLYQEILDDPKMGLLPDKLWRRVIELFLIAGRTNKDGNLPDTGEIAWILHGTAEKLESELNTIRDTGIITQTSTGWFIPKYAQRQAASTSTERSQQFRKKENHAQYSSEKMCGIYLIKCVANNKVYVGSSVDIEHRVKIHFYEAQLENHWMHNDFKEFGREQFMWEVLELVDNEDDIPERETYWILQNKDNLYNTETKGKLHRNRMGTGLQRTVAQITDIDKDIDKIRAAKITAPDVAPIPDKLKTELFIKTWGDWLDYRSVGKKKIPILTQQRQLTLLSKYSAETAIAIIEQSITNNWQGLFPLKETGKNLGLLQPETYSPPVGRQ